MNNPDDLRLVFQHVRDVWCQDTTAAYVSYEALLQVAPIQPMLLREYGKALFMDNADLEKALVLLERAVEAEPHTLLALMYLGVLYGYGYGKGYPEAIRVYDFIVQSFPEHYEACVEAYLRKGMSRRSPGVKMSCDEAIEDFQHAVTIAPSCPEAYQCLAQGLYDAGDTQGASKALTKAIQLLTQKGLSVNALLDKLKNLKEHKHWETGIYALPPSIAFHWPDEIME